MKKYTLRIAPDLQPYLRHLHPELKCKIRAALEELEKDPHLGKPLQKQLAGLYSYRTGRYRIIYQINANQILIEVVEIAPRKIVYEKILQALSKRKGA